MPVQLGAALGGRSLQQVRNIPFDVVELFLLQHPFKDVEAAAPVGFHNVGAQIALLIEADGAAVAERHRPFVAFGTVADHR